MATPQYFICPITHNIMNEPYVDNEGNSYEEVAIKQWLQNNNTSPITRNHLAITHLKPNRSLKDAIQAFLNPSGVVVVEDTIMTTDFAVEENPIKLTEYSVNTNNSKLVTTIIESINGEKQVPCDIVVVVDVSGSMNAAAYVEQDGRLNDVGFTILDITKHAIKTIIESLNENDRISIVTFSDVGKVICGMTEITKSNKTYLKSQVQNLATEGCTNIWAGLNIGLRQFTNRNNEPHTKSLLFMTDGVPSQHLLPPRGILDSLERNINSMEIKPSIYTFGFGYSLDTKLLSDIATIGNGSFAFIPDSGFVGTIIIHAMAHIKTLCGTNAAIKINVANDTKIKKIYGYENSNIITIGGINYGQNKELIIEMESESGNYDYDIELVYNSYENKITNIQSETKEYKDDYSIIMRLEFVELLCNIINIMANNTANVKMHIDEFIKKYNYDNYLINDLKDQVVMAISTSQIYNKWGKNYLYSLMYAHKTQRCNNFKDKSVSVYGGKLFKELVDIIDVIYADMEPPEPSNKIRDCDNKTRSGMQSKGRLANNQMNFRQSFHNASGGCFHENSNVIVYPNIVKKCKDIKKGDVVMVDDKNTTEVVCVTKIKCKDNKCKMVNIKNLNITEYHPIKQNDEWVFPINVKTSKDINCEFMYNFVLKNRHYINVGGVTCATLGHGMTDNDVIKHHYYGTDKVIEDLKKCKGFHNGEITFKSDNIMRDANNNVIGFNVSAEY